MSRKIEVQDEKITVKRGLFAQLIYGSTGSVLSHSPEGLLIGGGDKDYLLPVSKILEPVTVKARWFWSCLVVHTSKQRIFSGFKNDDLTRLAEHLNNSLRQYAENQLEIECAPLLLVAEAIGKFLNRQHYARDSHRKNFENTAIQVIAIKRHSYWLFFATDVQRQALQTASRFVEQSRRMVKEANADFVALEMGRYNLFFNAIESNTLTLAQQRACVTNEDNNLVLAGAGTGKTSTMIGRAGYLLKSGQAEPEELLMLAFARKAKEEMQERQDTRLKPLLQDTMPAIKTFHALGLEIIGKVEGKRPSVSVFVEDSHAFTRFIDSLLLEQLKNVAFKSKVVQYFISYFYPYRNPFDFKSMLEYNSYVRTHELRTLQGEVVKSFEECEIANFLLQHGIEYQYEANYKIDTRTADFRQYKPDFFLPNYDIYIEHFALNKYGEPPAHFDRQRYLDGIKWKRELHVRYETRLIETYSFLKSERRLTAVLEKLLHEAGMVFNKRDDGELLAELKIKGKITPFAKLLGDFLNLFKQSYLSWSALLEQAIKHRDSERLSFLLELFKPIYDGYQHYLAQRHEIDFADMIGKAISYIETGRYRSPYTHILVDEFQDISMARARLVQSFLKQRPEAVLFAVGDDWQAIYRFAGSDIGLTKHFCEHFGATAITAIDTTFRFNDRIGEVSSRFVLKNPQQIIKSINSLSQVNESAISLVRIQNKEKGLRLALVAIKKRARIKLGQRISVLVLARFRFVLEDLNTPRVKQDLQDSFPDLDIEMITIHAAKGKEADYVITLGMEKGKFGFPSEKESDALLEFLLPENEPFLFAEERRLFYVALTRARHRVYLIYNPLMTSKFIKELMKGDEYPVCTDEFDETMLDAPFEDVPCPVCGEGSLVPKTNNKNGSVFVGCNNYPYCHHTERPCPICNGLMQRQGRFKICTRKGCGEMQPICPKCGAMMVRRDGPHGPFWGCLNYRRNSDFVCNHTENRIEFPT